MDAIFPALARIAFTFPPLRTVLAMAKQATMPQKPPKTGGDDLDDGLELDDGLLATSDDEGVEDDDEAPRRPADLDDEDAFEAGDDWPILRPGRSEPVAGVKRRNGPDGDDDEDADEGAGGSSSTADAAADKKRRKKEKEKARKAKVSSQLVDRMRKEIDLDPADAECANSATSRSIVLDS